MKNKAFTLIELLAVIVILAIIALIATPIILGIIKDARENSKKRSAELVYTGVEYAYTQALFKEGSENVVDDVTLETIDKYLNVDNVASHGFESSDTSKEKLHIVTKDNVYCEVTKNTSTKTFEVKCGTDANYTLSNVMDTKTIAYDVKPTKVEFKPQYYTWTSFSGTVGTTTAPAESSRETVPPTGTGHDFYLGYDVGTDGKVSEAYSCFKRNGTEYCLKGTTDGSAYKDNKEVMRDAFADVVDTKCIFDNHLDYNNSDGSNCDGSFSVYSNSDGDVDANDGNWRCYVNSDGSFNCSGHGGGSN
jgi:prepilin-type N-terminal cleavage/methylation domain-containing protein